MGDEITVLGEWRALVVFFRDLCRVTTHVTPANDVMAITRVIRNKVFNLILPPKNRLFKLIL